ncbi:hypothetical protein [Novacetimonas pomaceti]|nr:hypothetical protein [Novacetimonas pomaceti]
MQQTGQHDDRTDDSVDVPVLTWRMLLGLQGGVVIFILLLSWWDNHLA